MQFSKLARGGTSIYRGILGIGFQMGWVGLAQNTKSGCAKLFFWSKNVPADFVSTENREK
jgi:hypothetical protein